MQEFLHEEISRGKEALEKFANFHVVLCGVGAIGSNLAENLARQGFRSLGLIDFDRVEEHNIGTQAFYTDSVGKKKTSALQFQLYRISRAKATDFDREFTLDRAKWFLNGADLVVDSFDRAKARKDVKEFCQRESLPCIHVGLSDNYGEVVWGENYQVPKDVGEDICNYPLSRNIVMLTVVATTEAIVDFVLSKKKQNYFVTLKDFKVERTNVE